MSVALADNGLQRGSTNIDTPAPKAVIEWAGIAWASVIGQLYISERGGHGFERRTVRTRLVDAHDESG